MDTLQTLLALANTRYYVANTDKLEKIINFRDKLNITVIITVYYASSPTKRSFCASRERGEKRRKSTLITAELNISCRLFRPC